MIRVRNNKIIEIRVEFSDFTFEDFRTENAAAHAILEAHAEGVSVISIHDIDDESKIYSLIWNVKLQKEN